MKGLFRKWLKFGTQWFLTSINRFSTSDSGFEESSTRNSRDFFGKSRKNSRIKNMAAIPYSWIFGFAESIFDLVSSGVPEDWKLQEFQAFFVLHSNLIEFLFQNPKLLKITQNSIKSRSSWSQNVHKSHVLWIHSNSQTAHFKLYCLHKKLSYIILYKHICIHFSLVSCSSLGFPLSLFLCCVRWRVLNWMNWNAVNS